MSSKKIILEIDFPEIESVKGAETWRIPYIGVYDDIYKIYLIEHIIKWFQNPNNDGQYIIDSGHRLLEIVISGLIQSFNIKYIADHTLKQELIGFLFGYNSNSGLELMGYKFQYEVESDGDHVREVGTTFVYKNIDDMVKTLVHNYTSTWMKPMYDYKIVDK